MTHYKPYPAYKDSGVEWMEIVPNAWSVTPLKYIGSAIIGLTYSPENVVDEGDGTLVLRSSNIQDGRITLDDNVFVNANIPDRLITRLGDILICSRNGSRSLIGKNGIVDSASEGLSFGAFTTVFRTKYHKFLYYVLNSSLFKFQAGRFLTTTINQLTTETLNSFEIPLPPLCEQVVIAVHLDRETTRIDALVSKKTRFIELLREKRQALITHAVTKGLDPNVKMKDSGIEWLGELPVHWDVKPFKACIDFQEGPGIMAADFHKEGIPLLRISSVQGRWASLDGCNYLDPIKVAKQWKHFRLSKEDLLISASASMGTVSEVGDDTAGAIAYTGLIRLRGNAKWILKPYIRALLVSSVFTTQIDLFKAGSTIQHFGPTHLSQMLVVCPPVNEQQAITKHIEYETSRIDTLINRTERSIDLLKERRSALITAAVTGQIDLREAA